MIQMILDGVIEDLVVQTSGQSKSKTSRPRFNCRKQMKTRDRKINQAIPIGKDKRFQLAKARQMISACELQKLAKNNSPLFLAIVRVTNDSPNEQCINREKRSQNCAAKIAATHGRTEGQKRQINKQTGQQRILFQ